MKICKKNSRYFSTLQFHHLGLSVLFITLSMISSALAGENEELFLQANQLYQQEKYEESITKYEQIINNGYESAQVYYNLGNAWFRLGNLGSSILNYERAKRLAPLNEDVRYNLEIANSYTVDKIEVPDKFFLIEVCNDMIEYLGLKLNLDEFTKLVLVFYFGLMLLIIIRTIIQNQSTRRRLFYFIIPLFVLFILLVVAWQIEIYGKTRTTEAVIMTSQVEVVGAPEETAKQLFALHEGTKISIEGKILKNKKTWIEIKLADGKTGWIEENAIERI